MTKRRKYTPEFKARVVLEIISGAKSQAEIARQHRIKPDLLARWRRQFVDNAASLFARGSDSRDNEAETRIAELERTLGKKTMELEVAKKASSIFRQLSDEW
jgi:transposase-like protein